MSIKRGLPYFLLGLVGFLLFVPFLNGAHLFDWDEVNFAEAAREMLFTGEFTYVQINFKPFWEKPPLFIWLQALSMSVFEVTEFAARLPNAICGILTILVLFQIGKKLVSRNFGLLWVLVYLGSMLPQFYFRSGIIDPWFNLFIFSGVHQLVLATRTPIISRNNLAFSALLIGLAVMTKGPTAGGLIGICAGIYFITSFNKHNWKLLDAFLYGTTIFVVGFSWFLLEIARGHGYVVQEFVDYHIRLFSQSEAGHGQPFYYHPLVLLLGCFPMSLFLIFSWARKVDSPTEVAHYKKWMTILFWVVLIIFSIVKTKIVHYSSLTYFPMSFLATWFIYRSIKSESPIKVWQQLLTLTFVLVLGVAFLLLGNLESIKEPLLELLKNDKLAHGNFSQNIPDGPFDWSIGVLFLIAGTYSVFLINRQKTKQGIIGLFSTSLITVMLLSALIAPKIDNYLQADLFAFYQEKSETHYIQPLGMHSYAHLFYGKRTPISENPEDEAKWMLFEKIDKPVYFISRAQDLESNLNYFPHLKEIDRKGGYVVLVRTDDNYPF